MSQETVSDFPEVSPGNLWVVVKLHSERTSGEVAGELPGRSGELPGKSGNFPEAQGSLTPSQRLANLVSNSNRITDADPDLQNLILS